MRRSEEEKNLKFRFFEREKVIFIQNFF